MGGEKLHDAESAFFVTADGAMIVDVRIEDDFAGSSGLEEIAEKEGDGTGAEAAIPVRDFADELIDAGTRSRGSSRPVGRRNCVILR